MIPGLKLKYRYLSENDLTFLRSYIPKDGVLYRYGKTTAYNGGTLISDIIPIAFYEIFPEIKFNSITIRIYPPKFECGFHIDNVRAGEVITIFSAVGEAYMSFRKSKTIVDKILLPENSLLTLSNEARWNYEHCIDKVKDYRVSFVFRNC